MEFVSEHLRQNILGGKIESYLTFEILLTQWSLGYDFLKPGICLASSNVIAVSDPMYPEQKGKRGKKHHEISALTLCACPRFSFIDGSRTII